jgi:hypothetical protein
MIGRWKAGAATLSAIVAAPDTPTVRDRLTELGADMIASERRSPAYLQNFVEAEIAKCHHQGGWH